MKEMETDAWHDAWLALLTSTLPDRFWAYVQKNDSPNGCWVWTGALDRRGYGAIGDGDKTYKAHRVAYVLEYGPFNPELHVCHTCDNPSCVRPSHLFLGTHADNMKDASNKGRFLGRVSGASTRFKPRLTDTVALEIYERYHGGGVSQRKLAREYGIHQATVFRIVNGLRR